MNKIKHVTALIALSLASSSFAQATDAPATIFEHTKFAGKSQALVEGMNVGPLALGNDVASSVKVSKCFKVTLYGAGPGQNGPKLVLTADNADLDNDNFDARRKKWLWNSYPSRKLTLTPISVTMDGNQCAA